MKRNRSILTLGILLGAATISNATIIGFNGFDSNQQFGNGNYASNATADGTGFTVANGATPNIALTWSSWEVHHSAFFSPLEAQTVGDSSWDGASDSPRIGQLDFGNHTVSFSADPGYALVLNSFDFGHTAETAGSTEWDLTLTNSFDVVVWQADILFTNGEVFTVSPDFTGDFGESYTLTFQRTAETYGSNGRHGIDNLSFNQVAIPEPGVVSLLGVAGLSLLLRRRK